MLGLSNGATVVVDDNADPLPFDQGFGRIYDGPILATSKVITITEGSRLIETVILEEYVEFGVWAGFCRVRGRWFVLGVQGELA